MFRWSVVLPYPFMSILTYSLLFILSSFATKISAQQILEYHPKCQYSVIETITKNRSVSIPQRSDGIKEKQATLDDIVELLQNKGADVNADAIIVTAYNVTSVSRYQKKMKVTADLIGNCDLTLGMTTDELKYSSKVPPLIDIQLASSSRIEYQIDIVPPKKQLLERPKLTDHTMTEFGTLYGFKIGNHKQNILADLGTPSFNLKINQDEDLVIFGRSLYLVFRQEKLIAASNLGNNLSQDIINILPFDERIDDLPLLLPRGITVGMSFSEVNKNWPTGKLQDNVLTYHFDRYNIALHFENEQNKPKVDANSTLKGYELLDKSYQLTSFELSAISKVLYSDLVTFLTTRNEFLELDIQQFNHSPIGYGWIEPRKKVLVYSPHLIMFAEDNAVSRIQLIENLLSNNTKVPASFWRLGDIIQGQSIETVKKTLATDYFAMQDELQIDTENDMTKLYFYQAPEGYILTSAEIAIY